MSYGFLGWLAIGLVAGVLGKRIMPGKDPGGVVVTILLGIAGALLARYVTPVLGMHIGDGGWSAYGAAAAGAALLLLLYREIIVRRI